MGSLLSGRAVLEALKRDEAVVLRCVLPPLAQRRLLHVARGLGYHEQPREYGSRRVRQELSSARFGRCSPLGRATAGFACRITELLGSQGLAEPLDFNDCAIQRYAHGTLGIAPHRDHTKNRGVIALYTLDGWGRFTVYEDLGGPARCELELEPNSLLLMRAPGFQGAEGWEACPVHGIDRIVGGDDGNRYLLGMRHNVELAGS